MAKYRVDIFRVEYFRGAAVVEASSPEEAKLKAEMAWLECDGLYEAVTDCLYDAETQFNDIRPATEQDAKECFNID